jgi:hypothetical protein
MFDSSIRTHHPIASDRRILATGETEWCDAAAIGKDGGAHRCAEADFPYCPIAAMEPTTSPGPAPYGEFLEQNRKARLKHLRIGQARIGHMSMDGAGAMEINPCARAAANRFVILVQTIAEGKIVHRPLRRREHAQRAVKRIGDRLAGFDIARNDRGGIGFRNELPGR